MTLAFELLLRYGNVETIKKRRETRVQLGALGRNANISGLTDALVGLCSQELDKKTDACA